MVLVFILNKWIRKWNPSSFIPNCGFYIQRNFIAMQNIKTFVFLDSETTGLPYMENNTTRMTELCFIIVESAHVGLGVFPRVQNKLNLTFNPRKLIHASASDITGLDNFLLERQPEFQENTVKLIEDFLNLQQKPFCFVAHNGKRFDFPILRAEIHRTGCDFPDDILCIDSLEAFRALHIKSIEANENIKENKKIENVPIIPIELLDDYDEILMNAVDDVENKEQTRESFIENIRKRNETTPSKQIMKSRISNKCSTVTYGRLGESDVAVRVIEPSRFAVKKKLHLRGVSFKLADCYERLTQKKVVDSHKAEADVNMLIECAATLGESFVDWANENAVLFSTIPIMKPGIRL